MSNYSPLKDNKKPNNDLKDKFSNINKAIDIINNSKNKLCSILTVEEINLPDKMAYLVAYDLGNDRSQSKLNTNQLRKVFEQIKDCEKYSKLEEAKNSLYKVLPLLAYAVGRDNCPSEFFRLLEACIKPEKLIDSDDIKALIDFLTSIVAYTKYIREK